MRILYDNLLAAASNSATNADANYPIDNIHDTTLLTEFRATTNSTVITCTLAEASTVSTFGFGNHNIDTLAIKLTDSLAATTTHNYTAGDLKFSNSVTQAMTYETAETDIVEIEYTITSVAALYIGGLSAGQYLQMPYFDIGPKLPYKNTGSSSKSRGGVLRVASGVVLKGFECTFNGATKANYDAIESFELWEASKKPFYCDRWEDYTGVEVLFANKTADGSWTKGPEGIIFDSYRLKLEECK